MTWDVDGRLAAEILCSVDPGRTGEPGRRNAPHDTPASGASASNAGELSIHWERRHAEHGPPFHRVSVRGTAAGIDLAMTPDGTPSTLTVHRYRDRSELESHVLDEEPPDWGRTLIYPIRDLAEAVREDREPASTPARQLLVHAVLDALHASARTGGSVEIDL